MPEPVRPERIDHLERPARPAVAELHRLVDGHDLVGHVRHERRRVAQGVRKHPPCEAPGRAGVLGQRPQPVALPRKRGLGRGPHHRASLPRPQIHDFARVRASPVEAAGPLVAGVSPGDEVPHHRDPLRHPLECVAGGQRHRQARGDVEHQVETDEVVEAEQTRLRNAHRPAHDRIRLLDRHPLRHRLDQARLKRMDTDPVGQEARGVAAVHDPLPELAIAELRQLVDHLGPRVRPADQLEKPHEAHGVEEVGDAEVAPHRPRHASGQQGER